MAASLRQTLIINLWLACISSSFFFFFYIFYVPFLLALLFSLRNVTLVLCMEISLLHMSLLEHFLRLKLMITKRKKETVKTNPEARKTLSPPVAFLTKQGCGCRMNRIQSCNSLMCHSSVLTCLFASVKFSFNVSGSIENVECLWMTRSDATFSIKYLCDANCDWLRGILFSLLLY